MHPAKVVIRTRIPTGIPEAPVNNYVYGRRNRKWEMVEGTSADEIGHLTIDFDFNSLPAVMELGQALGLKKVQATIVNITAAFNEDANLTIAVGTDAAQARLMSISENDADVVGVYEKSNDWQPDITDIFKAFFFYDNPLTRGSGQITIYFN